jgi:hypothetical protein
MARYFNTKKDVTVLAIYLTSALLFHTIAAQEDKDKTSPSE